MDRPSGGNGFSSHRRPRRRRPAVPVSSPALADRAGADRYHALIEQLPVAIYAQACDAQATTVAMSPRIEALTGYSASAWLNDPDLWLALIHVDDRERVVTEHLRTNATGDPFDVVYRITAADGRTVWLHDTCVLVSGPQVEQPYWHGMMEDITARKLAEEQQRVASRLQSAVARLGMDALQAPDVDALCRTVVAVVARELDAELCGLLEAVDDGAALRLRAAVGLPETLVGQTVADVAPTSQAGYTFLTGEPVNVPDLRAETRFTPSPMLLALGAVSGLTVPVIDRFGKRGVLGVNTVRPRDFTADELHFLQSVASVLTLALERDAVAAALARSEDHLRDMLDGANDLIQSVGPDGRYVYVNRSWLATLGYQSEEVAGLTMFDVIRPDHHAACQAMFGRLAGGEDLPEVETVFLTQAGREVIVSGSVSGHFEGDRLISTRGFFRDITSRRAAEDALRASQQQISQAFHDAPIGVGIVALDGRWLRVNDCICRTLGYSEAELLKLTVAEVTHPDDRWQDAQDFEQLRDGTLASAQLEKRLLHRRGHDVWVLQGAAMVQGAGEQASYFVVQFQDITSQHALQEQLEYQATRDALTGLANRTLFTDRLLHAIARAQRSRETLAVIYLDLDGFKPVNDQYGHDAGDQLLIEIAGRLVGCVRASDTIARMGGDEFTVLVDGNVNDHVLNLIAGRIDRAIRAPVTLGEHVVEVGASIGVASTLTVELNAEALMQAADAAMYQAKRSANGAARSR